MEWRDWLLIVVALIALRNFVAMAVHYRVSVLHDLWNWVIRPFVDLPIKDPRGGNIILRPGKGEGVFPDGRVIIFDADGNILQCWPPLKPGEKIIESEDEIKIECRNMNRVATSQTPTAS